jgi:hypothetical protein
MYFKANKLITENLLHAAASLTSLSFVRVAEHVVQ